MNATYYAQVTDGVVTTVHVVSSDFIVANPDRYGDAADWVETFADGSQNGKYAGIGDLWNGTEFTTPPRPEPDDDSLA